MSVSEVGPWAADKLEQLRKCLHAYTTIMKEQSHWCKGFYYIDAFAGPGSHTVRSDSQRRFTGRTLLEDISNHVHQQEEQRQFLAGSPRVALDLECPFSAYVFVEKSQDRVDELSKLKDDYADTRKIVIRKGDCNEYLLKKVAHNEQVNWRTHRAVVFLDPFGMQVRWSTIESLAKTKAIEVFLNFPVGMAIQRLLKRNPDKFTTHQREYLDEYFGSGEWFNLLYRSEKTLFGDSEEKIAGSGKKLLAWYRKRLKSAFGHVSKASLIRNSVGGHLYYLLLATPKASGARIASDILGMGERH